MAERHLPAKTGPQFSTIQKDWETPFLRLRHLPIIIALTGPTKTGKTIIAKRLVTEYGFHYESLSIPLTIMARNISKGKPDWSFLGELAVKLRQMDGKDILAELALQRISNNLNKYNKFVIDSVMHPAEIELLGRRTNLRILGIITDDKIRAKEYVRWYGGSLKSAYQELKKRDKFEQYGYQNNNQYYPNIDLCLQHRLVERMEINNIFNSTTVISPIDTFIHKIFFDS